jgi:phage baseplate assembly protein W
VPPASARLPLEPLSFPLLPRPESGRLAFPPLAAGVREMIHAILLTRPGELLLHPELGVGLEDFVDQPNTLTTRRRLCDAVSLQLELYEPRIQLDRVDAAELPDDPAALRLEIAYRLRRDGRPGALALTLRLAGG